MKSIVPHFCNPRLIFLTTCNLSNTAYNASNGRRQHKPCQKQNVQSCWISDRTASISICTSGSATCCPYLCRPCFNSSNVRSPFLSVSITWNISLIWSTCSSGKLSATTYINKCRKHDLDFNLALKTTMKTDTAMFRVSLWELSSWTYSSKRIALSSSGHFVLVKC